MGDEPSPLSRAATKSLSSRTSGSTDFFHASPRSLATNACRRGSSARMVRRAPVRDASSAELPAPVVRRVAPADADHRARQGGQHHHADQGDQQGPATARRGRRWAPRAARVHRPVRRRGGVTGAGVPRRAAVRDRCAVHRRGAVDGRHQRRRGPRRPRRQHPRRRRRRQRVRERVVRPVGGAWPGHRAAPLAQAHGRERYQRCPSWQSPHRASSPVRTRAPPGLPRRSSPYADDVVATPAAGPASDGSPHDDRSTCGRRPGEVPVDGLSRRRSPGPAGARLGGAAVPHPRRRDGPVDRPAVGTVAGARPRRSLPARVGRFRHPARGGSGTYRLDGLARAGPRRAARGRVGDPARGRRLVRRDHGQQQGGDRVRRGDQRCWSSCRWRACAYGSRSTPSGCAANGCAGRCTWIRARPSTRLRRYDEHDRRGAQRGHEHNATPEPLLVGGAAFGALLLALFIVTRFNKDR